MAASWPVLIGAALGLGLAVATWAYLAREREEALQDAGRETENISLILTKWVEAGLRSVEVLEDATADWIGSQGIDTPEALRARMGGLAVHADLVARTAALSRVRSLFLVDAEGGIIADSRSWPPPSFNVTGRAYFDPLRNDPGHARVLSPPMRGLNGGQWAVYLARRINAPDGSFLGAVAASIDLAYFEDLFGDLALGPGSSITLFRRDGTLLARHPKLESIVNARFDLSEPVQRLVPGGPGVTLQRHGPVDGIERIATVRAVAGYPLLVTVTRTTDAALVPWHRQAQQLGMSLLLMEGMILGGVLLAQRLTRARARARDARLREYAAALDAVFANGTAALSEVEIPSGRFLRVNRRYCEISGRTEAELRRDLTPADVVHPEDRPKISRDWRAALDGNGSWDAEVRYLRPDGAVVWGRLSLAVSARDEQGRPTRGLAVVQDITELRATSERLRASESLLHLCMQIGHIGTYRRDIVAGVYECGAEMRALHGLPAGDAVVPDAAWLATLLPEDQDRLRAQISEATAKRLPQAAFQYRVRHPVDGTVRHLEARTRYEYDATGRPLRSTGVVIDITESHKAAERLRLCMQISRIGTYTRDLVTGEIWAGPEARALHGLPEDDAPLPTGTWLATLLPVDRKKVQAAIDDAMTGRYPEMTLAYRIRHPADGRVRHIEVRTHFEFDAEGRPVVDRGAVIDVTASREAETLLRLCLQAGRIGSFRHDFTTGLVQCGPEMRTMIGLPPGDGPITEQDWFANFLPEELARLRVHIAQSERLQLPESVDTFRLRHPGDGRLRHFETRVHVDYGPDGKTDSVHGVFIDVTEQREAAELLRMSLAVGRIGSFRHDFTTGLVQCSPEVRAMYGLPADETPLTIGQWWAALQPGDLDMLKAHIAGIVARQAPESVVLYRIRRLTDGSLRHFEARTRWEYDGAGQPLSTLGVVIDVTEQREAAELLRMSLAVGRIGSFRRNFTTGLVDCDPQTRAMVGLPPGHDPVPERDWLACFIEEDSARLRTELGKAVELRLMEGNAIFRVRPPADGRIRHLEARVHRDYDADGRLLGVLGVFIDVTEQREAEVHIAHMARHDALTGLPNRVLFRERLDEALARARRETGFALLLIDLDRFKEVNDTLGHPAGDALLREVTARLRAELRETDTLARLGGDEFAVIQAGVHQPQDATTLARRMVEVLGTPFTLEGQQVCIGTSIGIALAPGDGAEHEQLFKGADMALYRAKEEGRNCWRFFEPEMDARMQRRRALETDLRRAVARGEFELLYQPIVDVRARRVGGVEALLRWHRPGHGLAQPDSFLPLAEEIGLIVPIGDWVLARACADAAAWAATCPDAPKVAVNLSPAQFAHRGLVDAVAAALERSGLDPARLELEITETVMLQETEATLATLQRLRELGVRIAMDDFGTGRSLLTCLRRFAFDRLKIDRRLTDGLGQPRADNALAVIRAATGLCAGLGMTATAEGVETEDQLQALAREGCEEMQGHLFARPCPAGDIPALLRDLAGTDGLGGRSKFPKEIW
ncbi:EAL domain-containing protein [Rhodovastum atsumiense]|uniref:EAL domain-containing protein n=1 Tax=Rhodovastum atsumiense TaxID=504468 RepID=UPI00139F2CD2|nr:EAL domain-containing protein [Rhodovastum atsumiense]